MLRESGYTHQKESYFFSGLCFLKERSGMVEFFQNKVCHTLYGLKIPGNIFSRIGEQFSGSLVQHMVAGADNQEKACKDKKCKQKNTRKQHH